MVLATPVITEGNSFGPDIVADTKLPTCTHPVTARGLIGLGSLKPA